MVEFFLLSLNSNRPLVAYMNINSSKNDVWGHDVVIVNDGDVGS